MRTPTFSTRKGITPVVAIILLLMLVIVAVGGMWGWISGFIGGAQEDATAEFRTELEVRDIICTDASGDDELQWFIMNTGETDVSANDVRIYIYNVSNGNLVVQEDVTSGLPGAGTLAAGDTWNYLASDDGPFMWTSADPFTAGNSYRVEIEFVDDGHTVEDTCQAQ